MMREWIKPEGMSEEEIQNAHFDECGECDAMTIRKSIITGSCQNSDCEFWTYSLEALKEDSPDEYKKNNTKCHACNKKLDFCEEEGCGECGEVA